jgi:hypothetical protein
MDGWMVSLASLLVSLSIHTLPYIHTWDWGLSLWHGQNLGMIGLYLPIGTMYLLLMQSNAMPCCNVNNAFQPSFHLHALWVGRDDHSLHGTIHDMGDILSMVVSLSLWFQQICFEGQAQYDQHFTALPPLNRIPSF